MTVFRRAAYGTIMVLVLALVGVFAAHTPVSAQSAPTRIMPLGDSLTDGYNIPGGYRTDLWSTFQTDGVSVDFVGSLANGPAGLTDKNHEGHSGWRIDQIAGSVVPWLNTYRPEIVLLMIGTNDMAQNYNISTAPDRLSALIDQITGTLPDAHVVVASIPRMSTSLYTDRIQAYNATIPGIVDAKVAAGKHVSYVDMFSALLTSDLHTDGTHMAASGNRKMANVWYPAILDALDRNVPPSVAVTAPANGATVSGRSVTVSATATDGRGVAGVQFKLDGANLGAEDTVSPYSTVWDSTMVADGQHTLTAVARDTDGATATATAVTVTVNNTGPPLGTVTFDDRAGQNQALNGQYPSGVIDWGTGVWFHSAPWGKLTTKSISFASAGRTSGGFTFVTPRRLVSLEAYNGGGSSSTVTLACAGQPSKTVTLAAGQLATISTGWTGTCGAVTVSSANGWDTNFDTVVYEATTAADTTPPTISGVQASAVTSGGATISWTTSEPADRQVEYGTTTAYGSSTTLTTNLLSSHSVALGGLTPNTPYHYRVKSKDAAGNLATSADFTFTTMPAAVAAQTVTFDDRAGQNQALNGQYPANVIDWGTGVWFHSGPWGLFTTKSISFSSSGRTSGTFRFVTPRRLVRLEAYNGGGGATTVTLSCGAQTKQVTVAARQRLTIETGWTGTCTTVTVSSTNGWNTNFDTLVHDGG